MKKFVLSTLLFGVGVVSGAISASEHGGGEHGGGEEHGSCAPACCEWSLCDGKVRVGADFLWDIVQVDGLKAGEHNFVGTRSTRNGDGTSTVPFHDHTDVHVKDIWESAFRVFASYEIPCCEWEVGAIYTYHPAHAKTPSHSDHENSEETNVNDEYFTSIARGDHLSSLRGKYHSNLNQFDLDLSRQVKFGECFRIRPHVGFRAAWADQQYDIVSVLSEEEDGTRGYKDIYKQDFEGYGLEAGLFATWEIGCGFSIVGHFGGSVLYSEFFASHGVRGFNNACDFTTHRFENTCTPTEDSRSSHKAKTVIPTVEYFAGLEYENHFCEFEVRARVGWEQQVYFDFNRFDSPFSLGNGNYTASSVVIGADVAF